MDNINKESKMKLLVDNFLIYGLGGIISKIIPFVMVPIITRLMPDTSTYGISDLTNTICNFTCAFALMGMHDALYRMYFEKKNKEYQKELCSTTLIFTFLSSILMFLTMLILKDKISSEVFGDVQFNYLVIIAAFATLAGATNSIVQLPTRMQNKRKTFVFMNALNPIIAYSVAIIMLLKGYYLIAIPFSFFLSNFMCEVIFFFLNREWFEFKSFNHKHLKQLLIIALPLLPNNLVYWVFNSCDKIMLAKYIGTGASGIYSVGAKLGYCSQLIYLAFTGGWQFFAFSTMDDSKQVDNNSRIFEYLSVISFACTMFVFSLARPIYNILFDVQYHSGFIIAPYLFLAPLLQMMFQVLSSQFLIIKKTWPGSIILVLGAITNICMNILLIPKFGIEGAAIATLLGYLTTLVLSMIVLTKIGLHTLTKTNLLSFLLMFIFVVIWRMFFIKYTISSMVTTIVFVGLYLIIYKNEVKQLINKLRRVLSH